MNVRCPTCETVYRIDPEKVPEDGVRARCTACSNVITVELAATAASTQPAERATPEAFPDWVAAAERVDEPAPEHPTAPEWVPAEDPHEVETIPVPDEIEAVMPGFDPGTSPGSPTVPESEPPEIPAPPIAAEVFEPPAFQAPEPVEVPPSAEPAVPEDIPEPIIPEETPPAEPVAPAAAAPGIASDERRLSRPFSIPSAPRRPLDRTPRPIAPVFRPTPSPTAQPAPAAPTAPAAPRPPAAPINPFLSRDPRRKARRLARALISDMIVYQPDKRQRALRDGTLPEAFDEEIKKSWEEYVDQVGEDVAKSTDHFSEALNEILAGGQKVF